jgi:hypothetical protein
MTRLASAPTEPTAGHTQDLPVVRETPGGDCCPTETDKQARAASVAVADTGTGHHTGGSP